MSDFDIWATTIGATLAWSAFDAIRKQLVRGLSTGALAFWVWMALIPGYVLWVALEKDTHVESGYWLPAIVSFFMNLLANVLFLVSVKRGPLSVAIPVLSFTPVFVALTSWPLLGETLTPLQWVGVLIVSGAAVFLTRTAEQRSLRALLVQFVKSPGVAPMLGVAILWSLTPVFDKMALPHGTVGVHGLAMSVVCALGMAAILLARGEARDMALPCPQLKWLALGGAVNVIALGLQLIAISEMVVSVFEAFKRAAGIFLSLLVGALYFRESVDRTRALSALLMAGGVVLVLRG